jgi:hypothetical protein
MFKIYYKDNQLDHRKKIQLEMQVSKNIMRFIIVDYIDVYEQIHMFNFSPNTEDFQLVFYEGEDDPKQPYLKFANKSFEVIFNASNQSRPGHPMSGTLSVTLKGFYKNFGEYPLLQFDNEDFTFEAFNEIKTRQEFIKKIHKTILSNY